MPRDSRLTNPDDYIGESGKIFRKQTKIDYSDSFAAKPTQPPFDINRFGARDLRNKLISKKPVLNPRLNYVAGNPQEFELFTGLSRFDSNRGELYDFENGRARTKSDFTLLPEFNPIWNEMYNLSPTVPPDEKASNPMPRMRNPDPKGYLMNAAEAKAENEYEENYSVAQLLEGEDKEDKEDKED